MQRPTAQNQPAQYSINAAHHRGSSLQRGLTEERRKLQHWKTTDRRAAETTGPGEKPSRDPTVYARKYSRAKAVGFWHGHFRPVLLFFHACYFARHSPASPFQLLSL